MGAIELAAIPVGNAVPLTFVRLRQSWLKADIPKLRKQIPAYGRANDKDAVEALEYKIDLAQRKIAKLDAIRSIHQHAEYQAYIDFCAQN
jgi:hypothetical protein